MNIRPAVKNSADPEQVKAADLADRIRAKDEVLDVRHVLETQHGRRFIWRLLSRCGLYESSFTGNNTTFFNEGKRDIGLGILADVMKADPQAYFQMSKESQEMASKGDEAND